MDIKLHQHLIAALYQNVAHLCPTRLSIHGSCLYVFYPCLLPAQAAKLRLFFFLSGMQDTTSADPLTMRSYILVRACGGVLLGVAGGERAEIGKETVLGLLLRRLHHWMAIRDHFLRVGFLYISAMINSSWECGVAGKIGLKKGY